MSVLTEITISCPHCRRQYNMKIDPERLQRLKTRATCGRCGKTFDAASRIVVAQHEQQAAEPKPARVEVRPPPTEQLRPTARAAPSGATSPDLRDEMEELAREFAEAAARFTPVGVKRPSAALGLAEAPPPAHPLFADEPTNPGITPASIARSAGTSTSPSVPTISAPPAPSPASPAPASPASTSSSSLPSPSAPTASSTTESVPPLASGASAATSPSLVPPAQPSLDAPFAEAAAVASLDSLALDADRAGEDELAAAIPTRSRIPIVPRSWLDLADPGLTSLQPPPSPGAAALEALLHESETIALPPSGAS